MCDDGVSKIIENCVTSFMDGPKVTLVSRSFVKRVVLPFRHKTFYDDDLNYFSIMQMVIFIPIFATVPEIITRN